MESDPLDETDQNGSTANSGFHEYVLFGGQRIARRDSSGDIFYYFADHLGTSRGIVKAGQTAACYDADFYPFGQEAINYANTCSQNYKFTGKERDSETGKDNFGARYYGSSMGRFMTPDPSGIDLADWRDPQQLNLYSYVRNNPVMLTDPYGLDCAYLNNAGNDIESVDTNSTAGECTGTGGYWVSGQVNQVSVNNNGTYQFGYSGQLADGSLGGFTYSSYLAPQPGYCSGGDVVCGGPGQLPRAIGNIQSANTENLFIGSIFGISLKVGAGALSAALANGSDDAVSIVFKHGYLHLAGTGLEQATVENAIRAEIQKDVLNSTVTGQFGGKVVVDGKTIFYRAFTVAARAIEVGTYTVGAP